MHQNVNQCLPEFKNNELPSNFKSWTLFVDVYSEKVRENSLTIVRVVQPAEPYNIIHYIDWDFALLQKKLEEEKRKLVRSDLWPRFKKYLQHLF